MALQSYRDLEVWKQAIDLVTEVYTLSANFPKSEQFGLTIQIRRASVSIASNIPEGYGRKHRGDYLHRLSIAQGSLCEVETQIIIAGRLKFITKAEASRAWELTQSVGKMLFVMIKKLGEK